MTEALPVPPSRMPTLKPEEIYTLDRSTIVWRIYRAGGAHPGRWNQFRQYGPVSRFDHHPPPKRSHPNLGVLYGAVTPQGMLNGAQYTCFAETFQETRTIDRLRGRPYLTGFGMRRPVRLLDLSSGWVTRAGGNAAITSGPRARSQQWAHVIWNTYPDIEGIYYSSSVWPPGRAVALFERAEDAIEAHPRFNRALDDIACAEIVGDAAATLEFDLV